MPEEIKMLYPSVILDLNRISPETTVCVVDETDLTDIYSLKLSELQEGDDLNGKLLFYDIKDAYDYMMLLRIDRLCDYLITVLQRYAAPVISNGTFIEPIFEDAILSLKWFIVNIETGIHVSMNNLSMLEISKKPDILLRFTDFMLSVFMKNAIVGTEIITKKTRTAITEGKRALISLTFMIHARSIRIYFRDHSVTKGCVERLDRRLKKLVEELPECQIEPLPDEDTDESFSSDDYPDDYWETHKWHIPDE